MSRVGIALLCGCAFLAAGVGAILTVPGFGSWLADHGRDWVGPEPVAKAEEVLYGAVDQWKRWRYGDEAPELLWDADPGPSAEERLLAMGDDDTGAAEDEPDTFPPPDFAPIVPSPADGHWTPFPPPVDPLSQPSLLFRAMVHPDPDRPYAAVAVVAADLRHLALRLVAGTVHPVAPEIPRADRPGKVPPGDRPGLVALFNGGWEAAHGHLGFLLNGQEFLPIKDWGCAIVLYDDERVALMKGPAARLQTGVRALRQTSPCLVEQGVPNKDLDDDASVNWGSAIGGASIIRRSAVGIDPSGEVLFYAVGDGLSAATLARAMVAAGATTVAMLDINQWFPRFYGLPSDTPWDAPSLIPLIHGMPDPEGAMLDKGYYKDFFYLTRR